MEETIRRLSRVGLTALALFALLLALALPLQAEGTLGTAGAFRLGLLGGVVVDPAPSGIENKYGAVGLVLSYQDRCGISFRPALLFNAHDLLLRFPLVLSVPLRNPSAAGGGARSGIFAALTAGVGVCTEEIGESSQLWPLLSAGGEVSLRPFLLSVAVSAVIRAGTPDVVDLLGDLLLIYLPELRAPPFRRQEGVGCSK